MKPLDKVALLALLIAGVLYGQYLMGTAAWIPLFWWLSLPSSQYINGLLLTIVCSFAIVLDVWAIMDPNFLLARWFRSAAVRKPTKPYRSEPGRKNPPKRRLK